MAAGRFLWLSVLFLVAMGLAAARAQNLSPLAEWPDWRRLEIYQETITREEFTRLLETVYAPHGGWQPFIRLDPGAAVMRKTSIPLDDLFTLRFAANDASARPLPPAGWRGRDALPPALSPGQPLAGVRIALDPGHLGGRWAHMEERDFRIGDAPSVREGEMTLQVANLLAARLTALGAAVTLTRASDEPATPVRPPQLEGTARQELAERGLLAPRQDFSGPTDPRRAESVRWNSEALFARADIRARCAKINAAGDTDLAVCLHFNAEAWGDPAHPRLVDRNHLHLLVNGCYGPDEIARDDVRCDMLLKLLGRTHGEELAAAGSVASSLAAATKLPPYQYTGDNALRAGPNPYLWARNLLANRLYRCPTIYIEPYVMNSPEVFAREQAGDYEGLREVAGVLRPSIFREYADAVASGLADYYRQRGGEHAP